MKKNIIKLMLLPAVVGMMISCQKFIGDRESPSKINFNDFFKTAKDLELYTNYLWSSYLPGADALTRGDQYAENVAVSGTSSFLQASFTPESQGGWATSSWTQLYRINLMLKNMHKAKENVDEATYNHYEGVARFWRARFYYDKLWNFGNVPWYDEPIDADDKAMLYKERDSREYVMHRILEDLDFASTQCFGPDKVTKGLINKYVAMALKSRVCLYEGTYRKYHANNTATNQPWSTQYETAEDLLRECVKACEELMNNSPHALINNLAKVETQYREIFTSATLNEEEVIWGRYYKEDVAMHDVTWIFTSTGNNTNRWSPTKEFVNTYLMRDGSPFTSTSNYDKKMFAEEFQNRDYRMQQTIMPPGFTKMVSGNATPTAPNLGLTYTGYQVIKFNLDDSKYEGIGISWNCLPIYRMGEIVLNYAEAKFELGEFDEAVWNKTIRPLRERAGVNGAMPLVADPYLVAYYDNKVTDKNLLEIRRERAIELFFEGHRNIDLTRWKLGEMLEKPWSSMYIPSKNTVYDLGGNGAVMFALVDTTPSPAQTGVYYIDLSKRTELTYNETTGTLTVNNSFVSWDNKKYIHPIPSTALVMNPKLGQNYGWGN